MKQVTAVCTVTYRTECNQRSKYFADIKAAYMHFHVCIVKRKSVELWRVEKAVTPCGCVKATQTLIDSAAARQ